MVSGGQPPEAAKLRKSRPSQVQYKSELTLAVKALPLTIWTVFWTLLGRAEEMVDDDENVGMTILRDCKKKHGMQAYANLVLSVTVGTVLGKLKQGTTQARFMGGNSPEYGFPDRLGSGSSQAYALQRWNDPLAFPSATKAYDSVRTSRTTHRGTTEDLKKQLKDAQDHRSRAEANTAAGMQKFREALMQKDRERSAIRKVNGRLVIKPTVAISLNRNLKPCVTSITDCLASTSTYYYVTQPFRGGKAMKPRLKPIRNMASARVAEIVEWAESRSIGEMINVETN